MNTVLLNFIFISNDPEKNIPQEYYTAVFNIDNKKKCFLQTNILECFLKDHMILN